MVGEKIKEHNLAFIDGQNLYMGTNSEAQKREVDLKKFRVYLENKYSISEQKIRFVFL